MGYKSADASEISVWANQANVVNGTRIFLVT